MPDPSPFLLPAASWLPPGQWAKAPEHTRRRYLARVGELCIARKRSELRRGLGVDGKPLAPRKHPRPDHADGKPLVPHHAGSRSWRLVRAAPGMKDGTVRVFWSHGWQRVLTYHAEGRVPHAPVRDVIGLAPAGEKWLIAQARLYWRNLTGHHGVVRLPGGASPAPAVLRPPPPALRRPARPAARPAP